MEHGVCDFSECWVLFGGCEFCGFVLECYFCECLVCVSYSVWRVLVVCVFVT